MASSARANAAPIAAPRAGAIEMRQTARSPSPESGATSPIARQNAIDSESARSDEAPLSWCSRSRLSWRKATEGTGPSTRNATVPGRTGRASGIAVPDGR